MTRNGSGTLAIIISLCFCIGPVPAGTENLPDAGIETVKVDMVLIDLVVRDRKDRPISGMTRENFILWVDGSPADPEKVVSFEEICAPSLVPDVRFVRDRSDVSGSSPPLRDEKAASVPRHIILWFDLEHLSWTGRRQAIRSVRKFVETGIGPTDRVMVLLYDGDLKLVQDWTASPEELTTQLDQLLPYASMVLNDVIEESQNWADVARVAPDPFHPLTRLHRQARRAAAQAYATRDQQRAWRSIDMLDEFIPSLEKIRGRKALIYFSDSLRRQPGMQYMALADTTGEDEMLDLDDELDRIASNANLANTSFYTVHASGLDDPVMGLSRNIRIELTGASQQKAYLMAYQGELQFAARLGLDSALDLQTVMAVETGGRSLKRTNNIGKIIVSAQRDLSCYYMLGYQHDGPGDGTRHMIRLELTKKNRNLPRGLTVRYRPYFIDRGD